MNVQNKSPVDQHLIGSAVTINENVLKRKSKKYFNLYRSKGIIRSIYESNIAVEIYNVKNKDSTFGYFYLRFEELDIQTDDNEKESNMNTNMNTYDSNAYKGRFRIALIQFLDGSECKVNYRVYDDGFEYKEGNLVIVKPAHHDMTIARIKSLYDYDNIFPHDENREVVCPIDISKYQERDKKAKEISKLRREMDKKVKELQGVALYELMAQHSPELRDMLTQFKELTGGVASADKLQNET